MLGSVCIYNIRRINSVVTSIIEPCLETVLHEDYEGELDGLQDPLFVTRVVHLLCLHEFRFIEDLHGVVHGR